MPKVRNDIWVTSNLQKDGERRYCATYKDNVHADMTSYLTHLHGKPGTPEFFSFPRLVFELAQMPSEFYAPEVDLKFDRSKGHRVPLEEQIALKEIVFKFVAMAGARADLDERLSRIRKISDVSRALQ